ncbi:hypothetical protein LNN31_04145 [Acetobacterium wieringae]|uniref:BIG2 domain-containing protein n=1 Tax=Acetobacterium wieringae TaxID=52694 RepID=A0ABY6HH61_9FIRM|nr:hypothetical protein [Acetobacterium wieringae]UYO63630.1 hypothetical protein LNN31_04145 [Acetobacterium wieringae]
MKKITASILTTLLMLSMVFSSSVFAANEETSAWDSFLGLFSAKASADDVGVEYRGHIQNVGDYPTDGSWIQGPERLGTVGKSLRLEAFWIKLTDAPEGLHIKYEVHVQNIGWMAPVEDGKLAGTQGDSLRIEAIKISLVDDEGNVSGDYTVTYKGHIQNVGDTAWIKSGQQLGTTGSGLRLEALEVKIEKIAPDLTDYEAALAAVTEANYTKASWAAYQDVVEDNVMTEDNVQSEVDAATAIILDAQEDLKLAPKPATLTATNSKTISITGVGLDNLAAADITVAGNTVVSYTGSADGKTGTVVLGSDMVVDEVTNVTILGTVYPVTYKVEFTTLAVVPATYDDDTANQVVAITMDGKAVTPQELTNAGYTVTYRAYTNKSATTAIARLFAPGPTTATTATGLLRTDLANTTSGLANELSLATFPTGGVDVYVSVQAVKGSTVVSSELAKVNIKNTNLATDSITATTLLNYGADKTKGNADDFTQNSRTLRTSEQADFTNITVKTGTESEKLTSGWTVKSSNSAVVSVDSTGLVLTAQAPGTATITITYGGTTRTETFTVSNTVREATKVNVTTANLTATVLGTVKTNIFLVDQYGDPMPGATVNLENSDATVATVKGYDNAADGTGQANQVTVTSANPDDPSYIVFTGVKAGTATVTFRDSSNVKIGTSTVRVTVVPNDTLAKYSMDVDSDITAADVTKVNTAAIGTVPTLTAADFSTNTTLDLQSDAYAIFNLKGLNSSDVTVSNQQVDGQATTPEYSVAVTQSRAGVIDTTTAPLLGMAQDGWVLVKAGTATGTATITITNTATPTITKSVTVTVESVGHNVSGATFKAIAQPTYDVTLTYKDALNYVESGNDPVISGITLTKEASQPIRLIIGTPGTGAIGDIYIDKNADGLFNNTDIKVGELQMTTTGTIANAPAADVVAGILTTASDEGTILYKVVDNNGNVVATSSVVIDY